MNMFDGEPTPVRIKYEPTNVKDVLVEMKDTAELLIDLAYSAVLHRNKDLATEVLRLEARMDVLEMRAQMAIMMAARSPDDAEQLVPVMGIVSAADMISDAAGDIAKIVLDDIGLPEAMRAVIPEATETLVQGAVSEDSSYAGRTLKNIDLESVTGVRVIAIRRDDEWILNPGPRTRIKTGDVLFLRGPEIGIPEVYETITGRTYDRPEVDTPDIEDLERAVNTILHMKNLSEFAVDLAYSSVLFNSEGLAEEVRNIEVEVDALESRFEAWTLQAAADAPAPVALRGLIHLGRATEVISDAAVDISDGVIRDIGVHPVIQMAVEESDEIITRIEVEPGSDLDGASVVAGVPDTDVTMSIIAIRRPADGWILVGDADATIHSGDVLIAKGTRTAADGFTDLSIA